MTAYVLYDPNDDEYPWSGQHPGQKGMYWQSKLADVGVSYFDKAEADREAHGHGYQVVTMQEARLIEQLRDL